MNIRSFFASPLTGPVLSGIGLALCAPGVGLYPLAWAALIPLLLTAWGASPRRAAAQFFVAGVVYHHLLLHWLMTNVFWAGGPAFLGYSALATALSLVYWVPLGALFGWMRTRVPLWLRVPALAILWGAMEVLQARLFSGFGWPALGYWQGPGLYAVQWAALGGVSLVSVLIVLVNGYAAQAIRVKRVRWPALGLATGVLVVTHGAGYAALAEPEHPDSPFHVGLYQSNYPQEMKWDPTFYTEMVERAAAMSAELARFESVDLFVWPEALVLEDLDTATSGDPVRALTQGTGIPLFTGISRRDRTTRLYRNSSVLIDASGEEVAHYDKVHLVPFGEYVPFNEYLPFLSAFVPGGGMEAGSDFVVMETGGRSFGPLICFEVMFGSFALELRDRGADFLVVITNLAWFGASAAIPQEFEIARLRAIEARRPLVHSSNTGITGVFDAHGRFEGIQYVEGWGGRLYEYQGSPERLIMRRGVGSVAVPLPAHQAWPAGPRVVPWMLLVLAAGVILFVALRPRHVATSADTVASSQ